jgi:hypothetical protein
LASSEAEGIGCSPREGNTETTGAIVRLDRQSLHLVEAVTGFGRRARDLEDRQVARDPAAFGDPGERCTGDVVCAQDGSRIDALGTEFLLRLAEVEHIPRVVSVAQEHATPALRGSCHPADLRRRWGREQVPTRTCRRESCPDETGEGRVVAASPSDHKSDLAGWGHRRADHSSVDAGHVVAIRGNEPVEHVLREHRRFVENPCHSFTSSPGSWP